MFRICHWYNYGDESTKNYAEMTVRDNKAV